MQTNSTYILLNIITPIVCLIIADLSTLVHAQYTPGPSRALFKRKLIFSNPIFYHTIP